ncbi:Uu.00g093050.m01.CDS01 [Anthostomella pinea]|uniref:Uu.00g093050.m01.CDS01 n=1 Tax=Anthostomella pinea TaxID=933095 RepID=A0AAI8VNF0_9PEZI|nr:Uu.00g093050.m01.CDS01 [Anthostomella pinea]
MAGETNPRSPTKGEGSSEPNRTVGPDGSSQTNKNANEAATGFRSIVTMLEELSLIAISDHLPKDKDPAREPDTATAANAIVLQSSKRDAIERRLDQLRQQAGSNTPDEPVDSLMRRLGAAYLLADASPLAQHGWIKDFLDGGRCGQAGREGRRAARDGGLFGLEIHGIHEFESGRDAECCGS